MENLSVNTKKLFVLNGVVQHYSWGGRNFIPALLKQPTDGEKPFAEYWLGAHENAPSQIEVNGHTESLAEYIKVNPEETLGRNVAKLFGRLPYLLKVLDVREMLSIQVHPSKENAVIGYEEENKKGIARNSPERNYKDDNHKPELMLALSDFYLLHGFKPAPEIRQVLSTVPELLFLTASFTHDSYFELYRTVMELPQDEINQRLQSLLDRILPLYKDGSLKKDNPDFWAARAALTFNQPDRIDRGIISIYLFNLVYLRTGQGIFQDAGIPHAYLEGQNMEIMANSDNVLRGGLTTKYIDVKELLKHVKYEPTIPQVLLGSSQDNVLTRFETPAADFELAELKMPAGDLYKVRSGTAEIYFVSEGAVEVSSADTSLVRQEGESFIAFDGADLALRAQKDLVIYRASVPYPQS